MISRIVECEGNGLIDLYYVTRIGWFRVRSASYEQRPYAAVVYLSASENYCEFSYHATIEDAEASAKILATKVERIKRHVDGCVE